MCECRPGTFENGWHEERSAVCREAELEEWRRMLDAFRVDPGRWVRRD
jgi:hypothetical protein